MHELLIPVGDYLSLEYAIANGADAVYLGYKKFNARAYAKNFSEEELKEAVALCHLYGVRLYVTMNTLVKDKEVDNFLETVSFLHQIGVDALIMQDFGMICLVRETFPNLEIHASTQANVCTEEAVQLYHQLGVKRVVLPREMSLEEIEKIPIPIEKEVFIHGALCMSYSGCCLMSSMIGSRSGNRGECTGCCRLFYELYENAKKVKSGYLLSTKELNTSSKMSELMKSDIASFKVEGRMKSPLYVGFITRFYRKIMDGEIFSYEEELNKLKILFNRDFTLGHLFHDDIRNSSSPNHLGFKIGDVLAVTPKKIKIRLTYPLYQEDGVRFLKEKKGFVANFIYDEKDRLIASAEAGQIIFLDNKIGLQREDAIYKTTSKKLEDDIFSLKNKKIEVSMHIIAKIDEKLTLKIMDHENEIIEKSVIVEKAKTSSMTEEKIKGQLKKLGNTPFVLKEVTLDIDENIFISIKDLNDLRRSVVEKLIILRQKGKSNYQKQAVDFSHFSSSSNRELSFQVMREEQIPISSSVDRIYLPDFLYKKITPSKKYFLVESFHHDSTLNPQLRKFYSIPGDFDISDYTFNVMNIYSVYYLLKLGYKKVTISVELSNEEIIYLFTHFQEVFHFTPSLEVIVYDRVVVMNIKGNILDIPQNQISYYLKDYQNRCFPVVYRNGFTYIYHYEVKMRDLAQLSLLPISLRYHFFNEDATEIQQLVNR